MIQWTQVDQSRLKQVSVSHGGVNNDRFNKMVTRWTQVEPEVD